MSEEAVRGYGKYCTARKREIKRHAEAIARAVQNHAQRMKAIDDALTPEERRIRDAVEPAEQSGLVSALLTGEGVIGSGVSLTSEPAIPARLLTPVEPIPAGHLIESKRAAK